MAPVGVNKLIPLLSIIIYVLVLGISAINQRYIVEVQDPSSCKKGTSDPFHEYFDLSTLKCTPCSENGQFQTQSADGLSCVCQSGYHLVRDFGGGSIQCQPCPPNQVTSEDGWACVLCDSSNPINQATQRCQTCSATGVGVERYLDGSKVTNAGNDIRECRTCVAQTFPDKDKTRCVRCNQLLSMIPASTTCECPADQYTGGLCFATGAYLPAEASSLYTIVSMDNSMSVESAYFQDNIRAAVGICHPVAYGNLTACQLLGNLCTLIYNTQENVGRSGSGDACSQYDYLKSLTPGASDWPVSMPWLYYAEQNADSILVDPVITTQFTFGNNAATSYLNFRLAQYSLNGTFLGITNGTNGVIQLCKNSVNEMNAAYRFGTIYSQSCDLAADELWQRSETELVFYDMYLEYTETSGVNSLYPIPVKVSNLKSRGGTLVNQESDSKNWQLTRRFFLVDNISTRKRVTSPSGETSLSVAEMLRYASSIKVVISLQEDERNGQIYPPYLDITYSELKSDAYGTGQTVKISFSVEYRSSQTKFNYDLSVAMGVLSCFGAIFAIMRTWGWSRRSGKVAVDFLTVVKVLLFGCGAVANVFFVVTFGAAFWFIIFYKRQNVVYLFLPTTAQEVPFVIYLSVAFGLKCIEMMHLFASQCTVDIFFIDWERPKGRVVMKQEDSGDKKVEENPVSIWRTYFVANEWNEIQTNRKIHPIFQIFCVVFFLEVVGFGNLATADPFSNFNVDSGTYSSPHSRIFRYAIAACVYLLIAVLQYAFFTFFYERFIEDKIQQFVDLCSVSNVSVFVMANNQYGYYIHGRSVHGTADTGMKEMHEALKREEEDLCGHRGLLPNNDQQTFEMALPKKLRTYYDRALLPVTEINAAGSAASKMEKGQTASSGAGAAVNKSMQAYQNVTKFLSAFIDHSLKEIDYLVKDKMLMENILDVEFEDATEKGTFYNDDGHSFDGVLFYGNEPTILVFDILLFCIVDLIAQDFILAGIITFLVDEVLALIRDNLGRRNLAKKTLVDQRFLI